MSFGKYPQSVKEDDISILNPNNPNSEGYYIGKEDGMLYAKDLHLMLVQILSF